MSGPVDPNEATGPDEGMDPDEAMEQPSSSSAQAVVPAMSRARILRRERNITTQKLGVDYDSCEEDRGWELDPGWSPESAEPPEAVRKYRRYCRCYPGPKTLWLRALRRFYDAKLKKAYEDAKSARGTSASRGHEKGASAILIQWQSIVQQVADKCLPLPRWYELYGIPDCLRGWYSKDQGPPQHLVTYAQVANYALWRELDLAIRFEEKALQKGRKNRCYLQFWCNEMWALTALGLGDTRICFHCYGPHEVHDCEIVNEELRRWSEEIPGVE
jgi:hypothetical protein